MPSTNSSRDAETTSIIRHSRLPAGNALWFFVFRRQGFRMITFDRQAAAEI